MWLISKVTASCALMVLMVMMMKEAAAKPSADRHSKHSAMTHKKSSDLSDGVPLELVPLQLDPKALVLPRIFRPLENVSISPWTYNISKDDSVFPPTLSDARCLLRGCLDSEGVEDLSLESKPIVHQVLALRRVMSPKGDKYHYQLEYRLITVGCTCVRPSIHHRH